MKRVILLLFMCLSLLSAQEVTKEQVNQIFQIQDNDARLASFDQWAKSMGFTRKEMESLGNWSVEADSNPMDDSKKIFFFLSCYGRRGRL